MSDSTYPLVEISRLHADALQLLDVLLMDVGNLLVNPDDGSAIKDVSANQAYDRLHSCREQLTQALLPIADRIAAERAHYDDDADKWEVQSRGGY